MIFLNLARRHVVYPMLFKMINQRVNRESHCGVLEFVAEEGKIYIPRWVSISYAISPVRSNDITDDG